MILPLLAASGFALWLHWEAWYCELVLRGHDREADPLALSHDEALVATASPDATVKVWDARTGECRATLEGHSHWISAVAFVMDNKRVITCSLDNTVKVWDVETARGKMLVDCADGSPDRFFFQYARISPNGRLLICVDPNMEAWDLVEMKRVAQLERAGQLGDDLKPSFSPDSSLLAISTLEGAVRIFETKEWAHVCTLAEPMFWLRGHSFSSGNDRLLTWSSFGEAHLWQVASGKKAYDLIGHHEGLYHATFSPDGRQVATVDHASVVRIWDTASGRMTATFPNHVGKTYGCEFSPDRKRLVTTGVDDETPAVIWDTGSWEPVALLYAPEGVNFGPVFFSASDRFLTGGSGGTARIWRRRRPEWWWGVFWLPELYATAFFSLLLLWSIVRDRKALRAQS